MPRQTKFTNNKNKLRKFYNSVGEQCLKCMHGSLKERVGRKFFEDTQGDIWIKCKEFKTDAHKFGAGIDGDTFLGEFC